MHNIEKNGTKFEIANYPWTKTGYTPKTYVTVGYDEGGFKVHFEAYETKLLMNYTEHTFTTPVFNGSTALRESAGEMIEEVCKTVRRKKQVNDKFIDGLYTDMISLYRLDQIGQCEGKIRLGKMPTLSIILILSLCAAWCGIITYAVISYCRKRICGK